MNNISNENKKSNTKIFKYVLASALLLLIIIMLYPSKNIGYDEGTIKNYKLVSIDDSNMPTSASAVVYSPADTLENRAATIIKAAMDIQYEHGFEKLKVSMMCDTGSGNMCASAEFTPSTDKWKVMSSAEIATAVQLDVSTLWKMNSEKFTENNYLDEHQLSKYIASQLKINIKAVKLPFYDLTMVYKN